MTQGNLVLINHIMLAATVSQPAQLEIGKVVQTSIGLILSTVYESIRVSTAG